MENNNTLAPASAKFLATTVLLAGFLLPAASQALVLRGPGPLLPGPGQQQVPVTLDQFGVRASASTAHCPSYCTDFNFGGFGGGVGSTSANASAADVRGNARALAELNPLDGLNMPVLKAEAFSGSDSAFATAFAVDGYTYNGPGSKTFQLDVLLDAIVFDPSPADNDTNVRAEVYLFKPVPFAFIQDIGTLVYEIGAQVIDSVSLVLGDNNGVEATTGGTLSAELATGEGLYLFARLTAQAQREGSFADAFSTLTTSFQNPNGLVSTSPAVGGPQAVPTPASLLLFALGLIGVAVSRRRKVL